MQLCKLNIRLRACFLGLFWNENRQSRNDHNHSKMKQEKYDRSKNGLKLIAGFLPHTRRENLQLPRMMH